MFRAITRFFRMLFFKGSGEIDSVSDKLQRDPTVMRAQYDRIIEDKKRQIHQYKDAVAAILAQKERKLEMAKSLTEEIKRLETLKAGAKAKVQVFVREQQKLGRAEEDIKLSADYKTCLAAFNDFSSTLAEKEARVAEIEADVRSYDESVNNHKLQLKQLAREIEKLKVEAADAVADIISAKEERDIADALTGISQDSTQAELENLRDVRLKAKANAKISRELAGTEAKVQEEEFIKYARETSSNSEFDEGLFAGKSKEKAKETPVQAPEAPARESEGGSLPEA
jgi:chromosome segregation ATPase